MPRMTMQLPPILAHTTALGYKAHRVSKDSLPNKNSARAYAVKNIGMNIELARLSKNS